MTLGSGFGAMAARLRAAGPANTLAVSGLTLGLAGASLVHTVQVLALKNRPEFLLSNALGSSLGRTILLATLITGFVLPNLGALIYLLWRGRVERIHQLATIVAPLCLVFMLPALFTWQFGRGRPVAYLVTLGIFALGMRRLLAPSLAELGHLPFLARFHRRPPPWVWTLFVVLGALGYAVYMSFFSIRNHHLIGTTAFDLGIYDNLLYNATRGRFFHSPVLFGPGDRNYIAGHAEFGMLLFVPFYAIRPSAETMLIMQAAVLGLSAVPLYLFARQLIPRWAAALVALCYLMFGPLHGPQFYDFHWLPLNMFFVFWLFYAVATGKRWLMVLMVLAIYAMREDTALGIALFGFFLVVTGWRPKAGIIMAATATAWFVIVRFAIMPWAGTWYFPNLYHQLFADGVATFESVIRTMITNPVYMLWTLLKEDKLIYVLHMLTGLALLPVRRPVYVLLFIPGSIITILTTDNPPMVSIAFQYTTHWIPYLFLAVVLALASMWEVRELRPRFQAAVAVLVITVLSQSYNYGAVLQHQAFQGGFRTINFSMDTFGKDRYAALRKLTDQIPREASVAATEYMTPHVSARMDCFVLRQDAGDVDYVFISNREMSESVRGILDVMFKRQPYGLLGHTMSEFYLFKKGHKSPETAGAYQALGLTAPVR